MSSHPTKAHVLGLSEGCNLSGPYNGTKFGLRTSWDCMQMLSNVNVLMTDNFRYYQQTGSFCHVGLR